MDDIKDKMRITLISDTHTKHRKLDLPGGDLLIHSGDVMNSGHNERDVVDFCDWFEDQEYRMKVFIAGNHDRIFEDSPDHSLEIVQSYDIYYLQDSHCSFEGLKIYGSPWQPAFNRWAFNLERSSLELEEKWNLIPEDADILVTHGPPAGVLDRTRRSIENLGCELLKKRVLEVGPKIHIFGHIHEGFGHRTLENNHSKNTHFFNASVLDEYYYLCNGPISFTWDRDSNQIT